MGYNFSDTIEGACNYVESSLESCLFQSRHSSCLSTQISLFRQFVFGPFIFLGVYKDHVFDINIKILWGEEVCSQALGKWVWSSRLLEPTAALVSKRVFCLLSAQAQKALWHPSSLFFFHGLSVINSLPDRILAGSYNGMYFQGSHFMTRKVILSFQVGFVTMCTTGVNRGF